MATTDDLKLNPLDQQTVVPTPNGQTPLSGVATYGGSGGDTASQQYYAWTQFSKLFGRNPTQSELDMLTPAYNSGDKHTANVTGGNSVVAQYYNQLTNTPQSQQKQQQDAYLKEAPKYYDSVNGSFQSALGRDATQEEKDHFGSLLASGQLDPYTLGQWVNQLPDAVKKQDTDFQNSLRGTMSSQDARYFNEQILPGIQQNFAKSGRSFDSSGFANAAAQAAQQQNTSREGFLTNLSASQYAGNKANAYDAYLNSVGRTQALQDYSRQRSDYLTDATTKRINDLQDYAQQREAYDQYLSRYGKRSNGAMGGIGALAGMGIGAAFAAPTGGMSMPMGAMIGSSIGGAGGSIFDAYNR